ncbi:MAG: hypothetical protein HZC49_09120 [Nitrospirae bacterium]|nr:hypothetical protein [Nitrospirota bacterium]
MTESEIKFEQFCSSCNIFFDRITTGDSVTPDYHILVNGKKIVVEIKELDVNEAEKKVLQNMETERTVVWGSNHVGDRIRYKVNDAKRQLESSAKDICPSMLIIYDKRPYPIGGIFQYEILVAMYGCETIELHVPQSPDKAVTFGKHRFGKGKKFRVGVHSYISGLAVLYHNTSNNFRLDVYVNEFADKPLPYEELILMDNVNVFVRPSNPNNEFSGWARLITDDLQNSNKQID